jgi:hypothetical protein
VISRAGGATALAASREEEGSLVKGDAADRRRRSREGLPAPRRPDSDRPTRPARNRVSIPGNRAAIVARPRTPASCRFPLDGGDATSLEPAAIWASPRIGQSSRSDPPRPRRTSGEVQAGPTRSSVVFSAEAWRRFSTVPEMAIAPAAILRRAQGNRRAEVRDRERVGPQRGPESTARPFSAPVFRAGTCGWPPSPVGMPIPGRSAGDGIVVEVATFEATASESTFASSPGWASTPPLAPLLTLGSDSPLPALPKGGTKMGEPPSVSRLNKGVRGIHAAVQLQRFAL